MEKGKELSIDRIITYLTSDPDASTAIRLTDDEQTRLDRINFVDDQLRRGYSPRMVKNMLVKKYRNERTGLPISDATAYRIISDCQYAFESQAQFNKPYFTQVAHEMIMETYRLAKESSNLRAMANATKNLTLLLGLNKDDSSTIHADNLQRFNILFMANPEDVGIQRVSKEDIEALYLEVMGKPAPKTIEITANELGDGR